METVQTPRTEKPVLSESLPSREELIKARERLRHCFEVLPSCFAHALEPLRNLLSLDWKVSMDDEAYHHWFETQKSLLETAYLAGTLPWQQSGVGLYTSHSAHDWEVLRRPIADCLTTSGPFGHRLRQRLSARVPLARDMGTQPADHHLRSRFLRKTRHVGSKAPATICQPYFPGRCLGLVASSNL